MKDIYAALDIGSAMTRLQVVEVFNTNLYVLYSKSIPTHGVKLGEVTDIPSLSRDIRSLVLDAQDQLESKINSVVVNIPAIGVNLYQGETSIELKGDQTVDQESIVLALNRSSSIRKDKEHEVISTIPVQYTDDHGSSMQPPLGKQTKNLKIEALVVTASRKLLLPYIQAVEKADVEVMEIGLNAYSCAKEALDEFSIEHGAIIIDVGYKTTTITYLENGYIRYITNCKFGGYDFTKKIASEFQVTMNQAEEYKIKYGSLDQNVTQEDIIHSIVLQESTVDYTQKDLTRVLRESALELMTNVKEKIAIIGKLNTYDIVLVGGGAKVDLLDQVASEVLETPVRMYCPDTVGARDMADVACLGLVYYLMERQKISGLYTSSIVLPDVSSTMALRLRGLTKTAKQSSGKFGKLVDSFFSEE